MSIKRTIHKPTFKAKVALAAIKEDKTSNQLASEYGITPGQISTWKKQLLDNITQLFEGNTQKTVVDEEAITAPLYQEIGRLKIERDWLKKNTDAVYFKETGLGR